VFPSKSISHVGLLTILTYVGRILINLHFNTDEWNLIHAWFLILFFFVICIAVEDICNKEKESCQFALYPVSARHMFVVTSNQDLDLHRHL